MPVFTENGYCALIYLVAGVIIDKNLLFCCFNIWKGVLYVKEILSQPVVSGSDLISVARMW